MAGKAKQARMKSSSARASMERKRWRHSGPVTIFQESRLPESGKLAGYSALIEAYNLRVPLPRTLFATGQHHRLIKKDGWVLMTPRHAPHPTLEGHLTFALKYEGLDLALLKRLFLTVDGSEIEKMVKAKPTGSYVRRIWFLYEWLTGEPLAIPNAEAGRYVLVLDPTLQFGIEGVNSLRHKVKNNLPGTPMFCPLVFRTKSLEEHIALDLPRQARQAVADIPRDVLARTAAFLLVADSKSSFAIEREPAPQDRIQRWGRVIGEAGRHPFSMNEVLRLQKIAIGDARFVRLGLRQQGGFVGVHDRDSHIPLPDHISARFQDLPDLIDGMTAFDGGAAKKIDPVIAAAVLAFGFVYVHPLEDGNGRLHRYLVHHVLAQRGFSPKNFVFPVSAAILERLDEYRQALEDYSRRLLPCIDWEPTEKGNVRIINDTADFYRFFDATPHAEFLYRCVRKTIEKDVPEEAVFLCRFDRFKNTIMAFVDMPDQTFDLLFRFLRQNNGRLSKRAREREFEALTDPEIVQIEAEFQEVFQR